MAAPKIEVHTDHKFKAYVNRNRLKNIVKIALDICGIQPPVEIGLVITDNETVKQLNKTYRNKDEPTDVLAFHMPFYPGAEGKSPFIVPPDGINYLGEVVISYPRADQQAKEQEHSIEREIALLTVHGVLHLLGYDHEQLRDRRRMRAKEKVILTKLVFLEGED